MPIPNYQERQEAKKGRYQELAEKNNIQAKEERETAYKMMDQIPFGQPIQVGHHSETRDRNFRNRIDNKMRKSFETKGKADYYDKKVASIQSGYTISQDDPEAVRKIKEKIAKIKEIHLELKATTPNPNAGIFDDDSKNMRLVHMTGYRQEIKRLEARLVQLEAIDKVKAQEWKNNNITLQLNKDENRIMVFFDGKPDVEIRTQLKRHGFRWSPRNTAWQSYINDYNLKWAKNEILGMVN